MVQELAAEVPVRAKWVVRKAWVAIDPAGLMHGPFDSHELALAAAVPPAPPSSGKRRYTRFTLAQREQLIALHGEGFTDAAIAKRMCCERAEIAQRRRALGLPANTHTTNAGVA